MSFLLPIKLPNADKGINIPNQRVTIASIVPNGTAPEECENAKKKLSNKKVPKMTSGTSVGTRILFRMNDSPPKVL